MSDKDINQMDFKQLRNEVQTLRDELAIMQRKYQDMFDNIKYEIPMIDGKYTITKDLTLTGKVTWAMQNSPVKTQYSTDGKTWYDEQISGYSYMRMSFDGGQTWSNATKIVGKDGSSANVTYANVNSALGNLFQKKTTNMPTEISGSYVYSGALYGGEIYGCAIYAGSGEGSYVEMTGTGLNVNVDTSDDDVPNWSRKIGIGYYVGQDDYPYIILGAGTNTAGDGKGCVYKLGRGLWIGDSSIIKSGGMYPGDKTTASDVSSTSATGIFIDLYDGKIYQYIEGSCSEIGSTATFG